MNEELLMKAKSAKSVEALLSIAKENGVPMDEPSAAAYFAQLHQSGELADEELDAVSGGGCHHDGKLVVTIANSCADWACENCTLTTKWHSHEKGTYHRCSKTQTDPSCICKNCYYCHYEDALWLCYHPSKRG